MYMNLCNWVAERITDSIGVYSFGGSREFVGVPHQKSVTVGTVSDRFAPRAQNQSKIGSHITWGGQTKKSQSILLLSTCHKSSAFSSLRFWRVGMRTGGNAGWRFGGFLALLRACSLFWWVLVSNLCLNLASCL